MMPSAAASPGSGASSAAGCSPPPSASSLVILTLAADFVYARVAAAPPEAQAADGRRMARCTSPSPRSATAICTFFAWTSNGTALRFIVIRKPDGSWGTALDACMICGWAGYRQDGSNVICRNCAFGDLRSHDRAAGRLQSGGCAVARRGAGPGDGPFRPGRRRAQRSATRRPQTIMFLRIVKDSFARQPRRKLLTAVALALGMAVATATLSVALDVGDRLAREFRSLGANLLVTPQADTLPLRNWRRRLPARGFRRVSARGRSGQVEDDFLAQQHYRICAVSGCAGDACAPRRASPAPSDGARRGTPR